MGEFFDLSLSLSSGALIESQALTNVASGSSDQTGAVVAAVHYLVFC